MTRDMHDPTHDDKGGRNMAALAHGLTFVEGGIIGPLVVYLVKKDDSEFAAFHALQSLYFGLMFLGVTVLTCGVGVVLVVPYVIFEVLAVVHASNGEWYQLPIAGPLAFRRHHPGPR